MVCNYVWWVRDQLGLSGHRDILLHDAFVGSSLTFTVLFYFCQRRIEHLTVLFNFYIVYYCKNNEYYFYFKFQIFSLFMSQIKFINNDIVHSEL